MASASAGDLWHLSNADSAGNPVTRWVFAPVPGNSNPDHSGPGRDQAASELNSLNNDQEVQLSSEWNTNAAYPFQGGVRPKEGEIIRK